ncbi:MAG TPA: aminotransferase class III-fold pyridoxal phosphate-dependent enzyme, partial [Candidatus Methylacidiphilales bacterium]|nr:aminotransferase class III-fold pyridoxal phosphate-dependent enzyme [Candidatus Methylacidiphilales bacterium]
MKTVAIIQARLGSQRFPNKVLKVVKGRPLIEILISRLAKSKHIDEIVLATSDLPINQPLADCVARLGYRVYRGSELDVLDRYYQAAKLANADTVIRVTGDCPLIDPEVVDRVIELYKNNEVDYASNAHPPVFPDGLDTEVFSFKALEEAWLNGKEPYDREHVTPYIEGGTRYRMISLKSNEDYSGERWTVDEPADFVVVKAIFEHFHPRTDFGWREVIELLHQQPQLFAANKHLIRNEGATMGTGQKLWKRAKYVIPGGNMLLSKRAEMYLPEQWPAYFSKASGCQVWDMDGNAYTDMSIMGVGTNSLGYGHPEVDEAVRQTVSNGNMSTLNCPEEVYLAEKLVELHPWADMARFTRGGGEANSVAIRIARAAAGKEKVAICGYHGWHDWYLAANLGDDRNLAGHLLPGLQPNGVPSSLAGTILPFNYNRFDELLDIVNKNDIGVIKMEVARNFDSEDNFLQRVRDLATERGIILIFDECT